MRRSVDSLVFDWKDRGLRAWVNYSAIHALKFFSVLALLLFLHKNGHYALAKTSTAHFDCLFQQALVFSHWTLVVFTVQPWFSTSGFEIFL